MREYEVVRSASRLPAIAQEIAEADAVSLDLETTGFDPHTCEIRLLSLNTGKGIYVIDVFATQTLDPVIPALRESKAVKIGQNLKFDQKFLLLKHNCELRPVFDTYRASALIYNGKNLGHDLYALFSRELGIAPESKELGGSDWSAPILTQDQLDYAAEDVIWLPKLREVLKPKLSANSLNRVAMIEFNAILPEAAMEVNGIFFDQESWLKLAASNAETAEKLRKELLSELPHPAKQIALPGFDSDFNLNSPAQLHKSLTALGLEIPNTSEIVLAMFAAKYPVVKKILEWRGFAQAVKTFGPDYISNVNQRTGRIHTNYYPFTGAGRYSSSGPNLQQIPRKKEFRACFRAPPKKKLLVRDYSQIELRIAADMANDETLLGVYIRAEDAHAMTASLVAGVGLKDVTKAQRQMAKAVNFGLIYGMQAPKLVLYAQANYGVSMTDDDAVRFRRKYFEAYTGISSWHREIFSDSHKAKGITFTRSGRLRYLKPDSHNEFANTPVQGTGADGLKAALALAYDRLKPFGNRVKMIHMVHDEIVLEGEDDPEMLKEAQVVLNGAMVDGIQPFLRRVPAVAEGGIGDTWAEK